MNQAGGEANWSGGELERLPEALPVPVAPRGHRGESAEVIDWAALAAWVRARDRGVLLGALVLIVAQLIWKSVFLGHFYFRQDDFHVIELALSHSFSWSYLTYVGAGHLIPGVYAVAWVVARITPYSWGLAGTITVLMLAAADLAALRLLRTLFGTRPAILIPLAVYLLTPLTMPDLGWWTSGIESLPLQIATFMALNAQVCYVRTRRFRHAVAAAAWLVLGLVFFEKALILPLLMLGVTSAFLAEGPWLRAIGRSLVDYWRGWALQLAVVAGYLAILLVSLHTSSVRPGIPGSNAGVLTFIAEIIKDTFVPGALGGPWQWLPSGDAAYAYSAPPGALAWLSLIVAAAVIVASIWSHVRAWRAWAILGGWLLAADIVPVLIGRITELGPHLIGLETRYVADAAPVLAICLGLAFWPVVGSPDPIRNRWPASFAGQPGRMAAAGAVGALVIGSVWSVQAYLNVTTSSPNRTFIANARAAVAQAPRGTVIFDEPVPSSVMLGDFGRYAYVSQVVGPMESAAAKAGLRFTPRPDGTIDHLMVFGADGRLRQALVLGEGGVPGVRGQNCQSVKRGRVEVYFVHPTPTTSQVLHLAYLASGTVSGNYAMVRYGTSSQVLTVRQGLHDAYLPVRGTANNVVLSGPAVPGLCIGGAQAGVVVPSTSGTVFPH